MKLPFVRLRPFVQMQMTWQLLPEMPLSVRRRDFRSKSVISVALVLFRGQRRRELCMLRVFWRTYVTRVCDRSAALINLAPDWVREQLYER